MKKQLATLQQLVAVMDPELYKHFGKPVHFAFQWGADLVTYRDNRKS
jgi:hypothetical protein